MTLSNCSATPPGIKTQFFNPAGPFRLRLLGLQVRSRRGIYRGSAPNPGAPQALSNFAAQSHGPGRSADAGFHTGAPAPSPGATRSYRAGPTLLSLRGRLMAEEMPGSAEAMRRRRRGPSRRQCFPGAQSAGLADPGRLGTRAGEREVPQGTAQPDLAEGQAEPKGWSGSG